MVGHSLGSAIALDALLDIGRRVRSGAVAPEGVGLDRIDTFITLGSPIDKVHHFFESSPSGNARYRRTVEEVRGDLGTPPFARPDGSVQIRWVNVWDLGDVISGSIETANARRRPELRVDDFEVATLPFPSPAGSHLGYFADAGVIGLIARAVAGPLPPTRLGPGRGLARTRVLATLALTVPWVTAATLGLSLVEGLAVLRPATGVAVAALGGVVLVLAVLGAVTGPRRPLSGRAAGAPSPPR